MFNQCVVDTSTFGGASFELMILRLKRAQKCGCRHISVIKFPSRTLIFVVDSRCLSLKSGEECAKKNSSLIYILAATNFYDRNVKSIRIEAEISCENSNFIRLKEHNRDPQQSISKAHIKFIRPTNNYRKNDFEFKFDRKDIQILFNKSQMNKQDSISIKALCRVGLSDGTESLHTESLDMKISCPSDIISKD